MPVRARTLTPNVHIHHEARTTLRSQVANWGDDFGSRIGMPTSINCDRRCWHFAESARFVLYSAQLTLTHLGAQGGASMTSADGSLPRLGSNRPSSSSGGAITPYKPKWDPGVAQTLSALPPHYPNYEPQAQLGAKPSYCSVVMGELCVIWPPRMVRESKAFQTDLCAQLCWVQLSVAVYVVAKSVTIRLQCAASDHLRGLSSVSVFCDCRG